MLILDPTVYRYLELKSCTVTKKGVIFVGKTVSIQSQLCALFADNVIDCNVRLIEQDPCGVKECEINPEAALETVAGTGAIALTDGLCVQLFGKFGKFGKLIW